MVNNNFDFNALDDATVYDSENQKIGTVGQVYLDDRTQQPKFVTVNTGFFGMKETFIPIESAQQTAEGITVPFTKDFVKDAPNVDVDGHLDPEEENRLFEYYSMNDGLDSDYAAGGQYRNDEYVGGDDVRADRDINDDAAYGGREEFVNDHHEGVDGDTQAVAHEERLKVGTEQHETGQARLRKRVRTEQQSVDVPVKREELVVERESIDPNSPDARDAGHIADGDSEEVITLREERPVVDKETVASEKVNIGKRTVEDTETVSGEVRKEEIELEDDTDLDRR